MVRRTVVTVSKSLHKKAAFYAALDGVTLEEFVISALAENVGRENVRAPATTVQTGTACWINPGLWATPHGGK